MAGPDFSTSIPKSGGFEAKLLPEADKLRLAEGLLEEFGVRTWRKTNKGELIHSCPLPGRHRNGDRNPSASLNYQSLTFKCYGCGSSGGLLWFMATCRQSDSAEAREWLNGQTGLGGQIMEEATFLAMIEALFSPKIEERAPIPRYDAGMLDPWLGWPEPHPLLTEPARADDPPGLSGRGIPAQTLWEFRVGYAPDYTMRDVTGTLVTQERITIPLFWRGELVGWQARRISPGDEPKYKNSPDFPRDRVIYNYDKRRRRCVLVESPMSVLRHFHHVPEMECTFGASVTDEQIRLLQAHDEVILWFDNDEGGWNGTRHLIEELSRYCDVRVVTSEWDADAADLDDETVALMLQEAVPWPLWEPPAAVRKWEVAA